MTETNEARIRKLVRQTLLIRRVEERIIDLYPSDKIQSPVHLSIGQEPVAVGICEALSPTDLLFATYRGHAYYLAKGGDLSVFMAELYGRKDGISGGKAGSMHLSAPAVGMMGSSAVVASTIPHAVGAALAAKIKGQQQVVVGVFGDGATEEGVYHESLNFAALHNLPVLFVCENNSLAVHTALSQRQVFDMRKHAQAYNLQTTVVEDGNDIVLVGDTAAELVNKVRHGDGPQWVMINTYRYKEHVGPGEDFDAGYRDRSEMAPWLEKDPLNRWPELVAALEEEVRAEIDKAVEFAEASSAPDRHDLLTDVI